MKKLLTASLIAVLGLVGLYGCDTISSVDSASVLESSRLGAAIADSMGRPCSLTKVDISTLPAATTNYITANYAGSTITEAAKASNGTFVVMITVGTTRKVLQFNADGTFKMELSFKGGKGFGSHGGPGGWHTAPISVSALPAAVTTYITTNYAGATITGAVKGPNNGYLVLISVNSTPKALEFNADGTFTKEVLKGVGRNKGDFQEIALTDLPTAVSAYITANYPTATLKRAAKSMTDGQVIVMLETTDNRHVALLFNADGSFKQVLTRK
ncbi:MAG: PepSY-like domain-containing protein [Bacteroidetes bacterium]|nr:PepSY-like domain-containing protein [Fibrella sp.]